MLVLLVIFYPTIRQPPKEQDLAPGPVSGLHGGVCQPSSSTRFAVDRIVTSYAPVKSHTRFLCCGPEGIILKDSVTAAADEGGFSTF